MASIAGIQDSRQYGAPGDMGVFQLPCSYLIFPFTFSGVTFYVALDGKTGRLAQPANPVAATLVNSLTSAGVWFFQRGVYPFTIPLVITVSNVVWEGEGDSTIFDFTAVAAGSALIQVYGSIGANTALTANGVKGDASVAVVAGGGFAANDWVRIRSEAFFHGSATQRLGEIQQLSTVVANTLNLRGRLLDTYNTVATATVDKLTVIENVEIRDLKILADNADNQIGIWFKECIDPIVEGVSFENISYGSVYLQDCVGGGAFKNNINMSNLAGTGYGVGVVNAARNIKISNNDFRECRHAVSNGGDNTYGVNRAISAVGNTASIGSAVIAAAFDSHNTIEGFIVTGNTVVNQPLAEVQGTNIEITDNICEFYYISQLLTNYADNCLIEGNTLKGNGEAANAYGILYIVFGNNIKVIGNDINSNTAQNCISVKCDTSAISGLEIASNTINTRIWLKTVGFGISSLDIHDNITISSPGNPSIDLVTAGAAGFTNVNIHDNIITILSNSAGISLYTGGSGGYTGVEIHHNILKGIDSYDIMFDSSSSGTFNDILIKDNILLTAHTAICVYAATSGKITNLSIKNNYMKTFTFGINLLPAVITNYEVIYNTFISVTTPLVDTPGLAILATVRACFVKELGTAAWIVTAAAPMGIDIDAANEGALAKIKLPPTLNQVMRIKVWGITQVTETHGMVLTIAAGAGIDNESWTAEAIAVAAKISTSQNFTALDTIYWTFTPTDDADIGHLAAGDFLQWCCMWNDAVGADIGTDLLLAGEGLEIEYV